MGQLPGAARRYVRVWALRATSALALGAQELTCQVSVSLETRQPVALQEQPCCGLCLPECGVHALSATPGWLLLEQSECLLRTVASRLR